MGFVDSPPTSANCPTKRRPVLGCRVRSPWCARRRCTGSRGAGQEREGAAPLRGGPPGGGWGDARRGHTPGSSALTLWDFPKAAAGLREGRGVDGPRGGRHRGSGPLPGAGARGAKDGAPRRPWPSGSRGAPGAPTRLRTPAVLGCGPGRAGAEGSAPAGCAPAQGDSSVGIRRKGSARRKGWTLEAAGASEATPGNWGGGRGRGEAGMWHKESSWVRAVRAKVCRGAARMWGSGYLGFLIRTL